MIIKRPHLWTSVHMVSCSVRPFWGWEEEEPLLEKVESGRPGIQHVRGRGLHISQLNRMAQAVPFPWWGTVVDVIRLSPFACPMPRVHARLEVCTREQGTNAS